MSGFDQNPFIVIWEVTRACALKCLHCRAEAQYHRDPRELTTEQGKELIRQIHALDNPLFVFTGGDPLMREDLFDLALYAKQQGLRVSMTPSATPRVTESAMRKAVEIGLDRWAFSLDGSNAEIHDRFRGTAGSFQLTMNALELLRKLNMPLQINTTVSRYNKEDLPRIAELMNELGVVLWSVFFLVPTGRGKSEDMLSAEEHEEVFAWLAGLSKTAGFDIKTTAAPHYRRYLLQQNGKDHLLGVPAFASLTGKSAMRAPRGVNDGNGFLFISHTGDIYPSGFLPIACGNVKEQPLADVYRSHPVFQALRDPSQLKGKCGICEFKAVCGGSRARAYATTGDLLESDPSCVYMKEKTASNL